MKRSRGEYKAMKKVRKMAVNKFVYNSGAMQTYTHAQTHTGTRTFNRRMANIEKMSKIIINNKIITCTRTGWCCFQWEQSISFAFSISFSVGEVRRNVVVRRGRHNCTNVPTHSHTPHTDTRRHARASHTNKRSLFSYRFFLFSFLR